LPEGSVIKQNLFNSVEAERTQLEVGDLILDLLGRQATRAGLSIERQGREYRLLE